MGLPRYDEVSIHALLAECDSRSASAGKTSHGFNPRTPCGVRLAIVHDRRLGDVFQSTHSLRSATGPLGTDDADPTVSIHALLAECDGQPRTTKRNTNCFNPRTPCGVRLNKLGWTYKVSPFQSTHSLRSATDTGKSTFIANAAFQSTHSLRSATAIINGEQPGQ